MSLGGLSPLAKVDLPVGAVSDVQWDGTLPEGFEARAGDELLYLVRAYGADGSYDETYPRRLQLVTPEEVERGNQTLRQSVERRSGISLSAEEAEQRSLVEGILLEAYPSRRYQSAWMGIIVHSIQSVFVIAIVLTLVL